MEERVKYFLEKVFNHKHLSANSMYLLVLLIISVVETLPMSMHIVYDFIEKNGPQRENFVFWVCKQQRHRPACASAQTDQHLCYSLFGKDHIKTCYNQNFNF